MGEKPTLNEAEQELLEWLGLDEKEPSAEDGWHSLSWYKEHSRFEYSRTAKMLRNKWRAGELEQKKYMNQVYYRRKPE